MFYLLPNSFVRNRLLALFTFFSPQENKFNICIGLLSPSYKPLLTYDRKMYDVCLESLFSCQKNVNKVMGLKSLLLHIAKLLKLIEFYNILKKHLSGWGLGGHQVAM